MSVSFIIMCCEQSKYDVCISWKQFKIKIILIRKYLTQLIDRITHCLEQIKMVRK